jgi:[acyl-carrier-protein] S-malonyltransferase
MHSRVAFAFPGAGVQASGYEAPFLERYVALVGPGLARASIRVGADLSAAAGGGFEELPELPRQAFTFAYGVGVAAVLRAQGAFPTVLAGHSLGVYAAAVASGALSFDDGLTLVEVAWRAASRSCAGLGVGMAVIAGLDLAEVVGLPGVDGVAVRVVLVNAPGSIVLGGPVAGIERALQAAEAAGAARIVWLDRFIAYHHPDCMADASAALGEAAAGMVWKDPAVPVVSTIDGLAIHRGDEVRDYVVANLRTPIAWPLAIAAFASLDVRNVVECGPGLTLTRMARFLEPEMAWRNVRRLVKGDA